MVAQKIKEKYNNQGKWQNSCRISLGCLIKCWKMLEIVKNLSEHEKTYHRFNSLWLFWEIFGSFALGNLIGLKNIKYKTVI